MRGRDPTSGRVTVHGASIPVFFALVFVAGLLIGLALGAMAAH